MNIKGSSVARLIDRLEKGEYVSRKKDVNDRRVTLLELTEKGRKLRTDLMPEGEKFSNLITKGISDEEIEIFKRVLKTMKENIRD